MVEIKKILIRFPNWLGDIVMALPLVEALRKNYPHAAIHALIKSPFHLLLKEDARVDKIIPFTLPQDKFSLKLHQKIKQENYDLAIITTRSLSSALMLQGAKIKLKIGTKRFLGRWLLTHTICFKPQDHQRNNYLKLLEPLGITSASAHAQLSCVSAPENRWAFLGFDPKKPYIILHPGASYGSAKTWPLSCYEKLALALCRAHDYQIVFCGDAAQKKPHIKAEHIFDLTGLTTIEELIYLIQQAAVVICNDSGPMHLAASSHTPLLALFGPTDPSLTGPISSNSLVIFNQTDCGPCFKRVCPLDHACMQGISVEQVLEKANHLLRTHGTS